MQEFRFLVVLALIVFSGCARNTSDAVDYTAINLQEARAHWLEQDLFAWNAPDATNVALVTASNGGGEVEHALVPAGLVDGDRAAAAAHLEGMPLYRIENAARADIREWLKGQFFIAARRDSSELIAATGLQIGGVLDDLYANDEQLGVTFEHGVPTITLWAPTAESVRLHLFDGPKGGEADILTMTEDAATGVWRIEGAPDWNRKYYLFEVNVYAPSARAFVSNLVTDPYSLNLSMDSTRSQIINLADVDLKPDGWNEFARPLPEAPEDMAIYELHVRDFSISDETVPAAHRGKYIAFTDAASNGMRHLGALADAGLTHVHLLPTFDCASTPENPAMRKSPPDLSGFERASDAQQAAIEAVRADDAFNWCYDPFHYVAPEGSFASEANGPARIREFREMVLGLDRAGLSVVLDVVFNHTRAAEQDRYSVLDRIVPGYYHRLDEKGVVTNSTCCANTASERAMMEKLMIDALVLWAREYKVGGFRFDLMGHHSRASILKARERLRALTLADDGVDGAGVYLYGEGWEFGEVGGDARFVQATQRHMGEETGVGTFNDRFRDALRGGSYSDKGAEIVRTQGFANGLYTAPNAENNGGQAERAALLEQSDRIRAGLAGSIRDFQFITGDGVKRSAGELSYGEAGVGYVSDPQETINYAAAHDNETLFDINAYKLPRDTSPADRVRAQNLANSLDILAQGVPFLHAGQELLRSKSLDRNSYDSGDWFNHLDFSLQTNGWGRGLPPQQENQENWQVQRELLEDLRIGVGQEEIAAAAAHVREMLAIRRSSPLFRLRTGDEVMTRVRFHNTGRDQIPGLIVMSIAGETDADIVVTFNATRQDTTFVLDTGSDYALHQVQQESNDQIVRRAAYSGGAFLTPAMTTAVFVASR